LLSGDLSDHDKAASSLYGVPGLLFFGDDTSRAGAKVEIGQISLAPAAALFVPEPGTITLFAGGLAALVAAPARRRN
ncbi:MAG: motif protein, partial [Rhodoferax sp.]|nr:motif protein [Rhodoferax sp.]